VQLSDDGLQVQLVLQRLLTEVLEVQGDRGGRTEDEDGQEHRGDRATRRPPTGLVRRGLRPPERHTA
jgi:hypothetical protein